MKHRWTRLLCWAVILVATVAVPYAAHLSADTQYIVGILTLLVAVQTEFINDLLSHEFRRLVIPALETHERICDAHALVATMDERHRAHGLHTIKSMTDELRLISSGAIARSEAAYYIEIIEIMNGLQLGDIVLAVNCIDERRWLEDPRQVKWLAANLDAAKRGVKIIRIFIVDETRYRNAPDSPVLATLKQQESAGIDVLVVAREHLRQQEELVRDWVLFESVSKAYFDQPDPTDPPRVLKAVLHIDENTIKRCRDHHKQLKAIACSLTVFVKRLSEPLVGSC